MFKKYNNLAWNWFLNNWLERLARPALFLSGLLLGFFLKSALSGLGGLIAVLLVIWVAFNSFYPPK